MDSNGKDQARNESSRKNIKKPFKGKGSLGKDLKFLFMKEIIALKLFRVMPRCQISLINIILKFFHLWL